MFGTWPSSSCPGAPCQNCYTCQAPWSQQVTVGNAFDATCTYNQFYFYSDGACCYDPTCYNGADQWSSQLPQCQSLLAGFDGWDYSVSSGASFNYTVNCDGSVSSSYGPDEGQGAALAIQYGLNFSGSRIMVCGLQFVYTGIPPNYGYTVPAPTDPFCVTSVCFPTYWATGIPISTTTTTYPALAAGQCMEITYQGGPCGVYTAAELDPYAVANGCEPGSCTLCGQPSDTPLVLAYYATVGCGACGDDAPP